MAPKESHWWKHASWKNPKTNSHGPSKSTNSLDGLEWVSAWERSLIRPSINSTTTRLDMACTSLQEMGTLGRILTPQAIQNAKGFLLWREIWLLWCMIPCLGSFSSSNTMERKINKENFLISQSLIMTIACVPVLICCWKMMKWKLWLFQKGTDIMERKTNNLKFLI